MQARHETLDNRARQQLERADACEQLGIEKSGCSCWGHVSRLQDLQNSQDDKMHPVYSANPVNPVSQTTLWFRYALYQLLDDLIRVNLLSFSLEI